MHIGHFGKTFLLATLAVTITGCAGSFRSETPKYETPKLDAPFYITFSPEGEPVVLNSKGEELVVEGAVVEIPNKSTIKRATNFATLEIQGSHYYLLYINGRAIKIPLPHP